MKTIKLIFWMLGLTWLPLCAQSSKTTMLQQIAALRVYGQYVHKGYQIVDKGLNVVGGFKNGEFTLHKDYFESLGMVSPFVTHHDMVLECLQLQENILRLSSKLPTVQSADFTSEETAYFSRVKNRLLDSCEDEMDRLEAVTTNQSLVMDDSERIMLLTAIRNEMRADYTFIKKFSDAVSLLKRERQRGARDVERTRELYNIK